MRTNLLKLWISTHIAWKAQGREGVGGEGKRYFMESTMWIMFLISRLGLGDKGGKETQQDWTKIKS